MLVITRRVGESIVIGDNVEILIADMAGDKVRICIDAPKAIPVFRKELLETSALNKEAANAHKSQVAQLKNFTKIIEKKHL